MLLIFIVLYLRRWRKGSSCRCPRRQGWQCGTSPLLVILATGGGWILILGVGVLVGFGFGYWLCAAARLQRARQMYLLQLYVATRWHVTCSTGLVNVCSRYNSYYIYIYIYIYINRNLAKFALSFCCTYCRVRRGTYIHSFGGETWGNDSPWKT